MWSIPALDLYGLQKDFIVLTAGYMITGLRKSVPRLQNGRETLQTCTGIGIFTIIPLLQLELALESVGM